MSSLDVDAERLARAWSSIIPAYHTKCCETAANAGIGGVNVFRFLSDTQTRVAEVVSGADDKVYNCEYNYIPIESPLWKSVFGGSQNLDKITSKYDRNKHILVSVNVTAVEGEDTTVGSIRIFDTCLDDKGTVVEIDY